MTMILVMVLEYSLEYHMSFMLMSFGNISRLCLCFTGWATAAIKITQVFNFADFCPAGAT